MAKKSSSYYESEETDNWNVALDFSKLKIMKLLYELDPLFITAKFGTSNINDDMIITEEIKNYSRIKALNRIHHILGMIIDNTLFAVKSEDRIKMEEYLTMLNGLEKFLPLIEDTKIDQRYNKSTIEIKEDYFNIIYNLLRDMKRDMLKPLNKANLIFKGGDDFDPDKFKRDMEEDIVFAG